MVCSDLRKLYESFKPYLPLIIALRNPSLKLRHWENLQNLRNPPIYELESEMHASIHELAERCQIMEIVEEINDISDCASREKKLEDAI
jgi:dynein heavy chain, axonemal